MRKCGWTCGCGCGCGCVVVCCVVCCVCCVVWLCLLWLWLFVVWLWLFVCCVVVVVCLLCGCGCCGRFSPHRLWPKIGVLVFWPNHKEQEIQKDARIKMKKKQRRTNKETKIQSKKSAFFGKRGSGLADPSLPSPPPPGASLEGPRVSGSLFWTEARRDPFEPAPGRVKPRRVGPRRVGGPKFRAFFPSPAPMFILSSLSWGSYRGILVVFEARRSLKCERLEFSGCRVKPRRPRKWGRERKKARNFGAPPFWAPPFSAPPFAAPHFGSEPFGARFFLGLGRTPFAPPPSGPKLARNQDGQTWIGPNWTGQKWPNQDGQNGIGQSRSLPAPHPVLLLLRCCCVHL